MGEQKLDQPRRKITDAADNRMRTRSAKKQLTQALEEARRGPQDIPAPDADDASIKRYN